MPSLDLACRSAVSRRVLVNGLSLHLLEWGERGRPGLCFLHGGSAHAHWFDLVAGAFADRFNVVSVDQRGHGESDWAEPPAYATQDFTGDLLALFDALGWERVILVGHSMGGHNSMSFASWHPERVRALTIVDSRPAIPAERLGVMHQRGRRPIRHYASIDAAASAFRLLPRETLADPALLRHLGAAGAAQREGGWAFRVDPAVSGARRPVDAWEIVHAITAPTLIVRAEKSPVLTREQAARLHGLIRGSEVVEIPEAYHHLTLDRPREFAAVLAEFLARV